MLFCTCMKCESFFFVLSRTWDKERILSLCEESNLKSSDSALQCSTTDPQRLHGEQSHYEVIPYVNTCSMLTNAMADDTLLVSPNINEPSTRLLKKSNLYHQTIFFLLLFIIPFSFTVTVAAICPGTFICLRKSSKRLRKCSGVFVNDRVLYKNPDTLEINITRFWLKKRWKVSEIVDIMKLVWIKWFKRNLCCAVSVLFITVRRCTE